MLSFNEKDLDGIREFLPDILSDHRLCHVLAVEDMALRIGKLFFDAEDDLLLLRAAALFHDLTKERSLPEQIEIANKAGRPFTQVELSAPKTLHALTAAMVIEAEYPRFAHEVVLSTVARHSTGCADMNLFQKIIFLSDYIDESRKFPDCVRLRAVFWDAKPENMNAEERVEHLDSTVLRALDLTISEILERGGVINPDTIGARNSLIMAREKKLYGGENG